MWTLDNALKLYRRLVPRAKAVGWHLGLHGGVLERGFSKHDLDLVAFPLRMDQPHEVDDLRGVFRDAGLVLTFDVDFVRKQWAKKGSTDTKHVECWFLGKKRCDLFVFSERGPVE